MLTLDGIEFGGFELPDKMPIGGSQHLVVHKVIGGKRVIDAMGPDDAPLEWSGRFLDEFAETKAFRLDLLRRSGRQVQLTFALRAYKVVVSSFKAEMERPYLWSYTIACEVVQDLVAGDGDQKSATLEQEVEADLAAAQAAAAGRDRILTFVGLASTAVRAAMGDPQARHGLGSLAISVAQGMVGEAVAEATGEASAANVAIAAVGGVGGVIMGGDPKAMAENFLGTVVAVEAAHSAGLVSASMTRVGTNMGGLVS